MRLELRHTVARDTEASYVPSPFLNLFLVLQILLDFAGCTNIITFQNYVFFDAPRL